MGRDRADEQKASSPKRRSRAPAEPAAPAAPKPTRTFHPARTARAPRSGGAPRHSGSGASAALASAVADRIPRNVDAATVRVGDREVALTNLRKVFFPRRGTNKGDLLRYYAEIAPVLLPHVRDRAMVLRRYPDGAEGKSFFMKRAPSPRPEWIELCSIEHASGNVIDFPMVQDLLSLLWAVNLGCIDLNQWYARCDDVDRPDYLHFDLDPGPRASFAMVRETALVVHAALDDLGLPNLAKTSGSRGIHVYVPIVRGPNQKSVWTFARDFALAIEAARPDLVTSEYRVADRPVDRVLVDYNQNAWGRTLASIYSVRPRPEASVSTPVTWDEVSGGVETADFTIDNVPARVRELGDLWQPLLSSRGRARLRGSP
ncbi:MAG TPA: non-homologous end-joining DNA ligase [Candidatus Binatia bacterium]|nr:non-homologous end-joining DNA ligase [Candidatus Binatia bacterium]